MTTAKETTTKKAPIKRAVQKTAPKAAPKKPAPEAAPAQKAAAKKAPPASAEASARQAKKHTVKSGGFAVIETGGKQYKISEGDSISIEKLAGDHKEGSKVIFDKVLLLDDGKTTEVGAPYIAGAKIEAEFVEGGRGKKLYIARFRAKSRYRRRIGHRQPYSKVAISKI